MRWEGHTKIDDSLRAFMERQHLFFVATAPLAESGHVNCSPKGLESLRILGPKTLAYLDLVGSGIEPIAHVRENRRVVLMFCAFDGPPKIVRVHGRGRVIEPEEPEFRALISAFSPKVGVRSIVVIDVTRIGDSCGFGVPLMDYEGDRTHLITWAERKDPAGLTAYKREKNMASIDGLQGLRALRANAEK